MGENTANFSPLKGNRSPTGPVTSSSGCQAGKSLHSPARLINPCIALLGDGLDQKGKKDIMLPEKLQELAGDGA